jgi:hypothetical protein
MPAQQFSAEDLLVDVQFGDPVLMTVVGVVTATTKAVLEDALTAVSALPARPDVEVNLVLARFDDDGRELLLQAAVRARRSGQRFTTNSLDFEESAT